MTTDHYLDEWHHSDDPPADGDDDECAEREYAEVGGGEWATDEEMERRRCRALGDDEQRQQEGALWPWLDEEG